MAGEIIAVVQLRDVIERAISEGSGDVVKSVELASKYALERLKASIEFKRLSESTIRYAESKAIEYAREKVGKKAPDKVVRGALIEFLEVILANEYNRCTPSEGLGMLFKTGLFCLALDDISGIAGAYNPKKDEVIIAKSKYLWKLRVFPEVY